MDNTGLYPVEQEMELGLYSYSLTSGSCCAVHGCMLAAKLRCAKCLRCVNIDPKAHGLCSVTDGTVSIASLHTRSHIDK